jgi:hypothetical protein
MGKGSSERRIADGVSESWSRIIKENSCVSFIS